MMHSVLVRRIKTCCIQSAARRGARCCADRTPANVADGPLARSSQHPTLRILNRCVKYYTVSQELAFLAVADARRRAILTLLKRGERSAGGIARHFDVSWPAISRHLRILKEAGLVRERRQGRQRRYVLDRSRIRDVFGGWVAGFDARWEENLDALRAHVEARTARKAL